MVWLLEYFFRMWEICVQFSPISDHVCIHTQLRRVSKQQVGGLSPVLLFQSTKTLQHLLVQKLGTCATFYGKSLTKCRLICLLSSEYLVLYKKFCSVSICRWCREWHEVYYRTIGELALLPKGEVKRANHTWHVSHIDECIIRKYSDIMVVRAVWKSYANRMHFWEGLAWYLPGRRSKVQRSWTNFQKVSLS